MVGRRCSVEPERIIAAALYFKDRIINVKGGVKGVAVATNSVWSDMSIYLGGSISKGALHLIVQQGRYNIKSVLGLTCTPVEVISPVNINQNIETTQLQNTCDGFSNSESDSSDVGLQNYPYKKFIITLSSEEWKQIEPVEVRYKTNEASRPGSSRTYFVLPKGMWTTLIAEHFWVHTKLPCCLAFRRSKVYSEGNTFISVVGRCSECESRFKGTVAEKPSDGSRVLMECEYVGDFDVTHGTTKKRRMVGQSKSTAESWIVKEKMSCETFREMEAVRLMSLGDNEPSIIPSGPALRTLKWRQKSRDRRHPDTLTALCIMKNEDEYKSVIHDIGCDPFFVHYHSSEQIHVYRNYSKNSHHSKIIIDATGSIIKNFKKLGQKETSKIFLYEALVHDSEKNHSFTISNMVSERHSNVSITNWLAKWLSCDVPRPKETVCDQSLALLSSIVQCFTQYSSLQVYLDVCADLILKKLQPDTHWLPQCYVRTDVAHFIKLVCKWVPLKSTTPLVKQIILRSIGLIVKSQSLNDVYSLLLSLFIVLTNDTDGNDIVTNELTPCQRHKNFIRDATSSGFIEYEEEFNIILAHIEDEDEARRIIEEEYDNQYEGLNSIKNPFQSWAEAIFEKSKNMIRTGSGINAMFLPSLVPLIIKCLKFLPLWSGIMVPIFKYGNETSSSAAVESSFRKLKIVTFKDVTLPTSLEIFLERHISSLRGASLFRSVPQSNPTKNHKLVNEGSNGEFMTQELVPMAISSYLNYQPTKCSLCSTGETPSLNGAHKCRECGIPVHALPTCSGHKTGCEDMRLCFKCINDESNLREEDTHQETWSRRPEKQRRLNSYLVPNPHIGHLELDTTQNIKSLPILKNGSRAEELKSCRVKNMGKVILSNTCAFDTIVSILMVGYCDSKYYSSKVDNLNIRSPIMDFVKCIIQKGISSSTYSDRASLMVNHLQPNIEQLEYGTSIAVCDTTMGCIINTFFSELPTVMDEIKCSEPNCRKTTLVPKTAAYITVNITNGDLTNFQKNIDSRMNTEKSICGHVDEKNNPCKGHKIITPIISPVHLFIELLSWNGDDLNTSQYSTEIAPQVELELSKIPPVLKLKDTNYELRGVCCFRKGLSRLRNTVGHFTAYCKRSINNWEIIDDLKKKPVQVKGKSTVPGEFLVYTI